MRNLASLTPVSLTLAIAAALATACTQTGEPARLGDDRAPPEPLVEPLVEPTPEVEAEENEVARNEVAPTPRPPSENECVFTDEGGLTTRFEVIDGRVVTQRADSPFGVTFVVNNTYDDAGRLVSISVEAQGATPRPPQTETITYENNAAEHQVVERRSPTGSVTTWTYDSAGRPTGRTLERGDRVYIYACRYDEAGRPVHYEHQGSDGTTTRTWSYAGSSRLPDTSTLRRPADPAAIQYDVVQEGQTVEHRAASATIRYVGACEPLYFPAECTRNRAPPAP